MSKLCPFCAEPTLAPSPGPRSWRQGSYQMQTCGSCGTETAWPREAASDSVYDHEMPAIRWEFREVLTDLAGYPSVEGEVLDVGCGKGDFVALANGQGVTARGIDFNPENIAYSQARGLDCRQMDVRDLEEAQTFRAITAFHVLEHLSDPRAFLVVLRDRLLPGGALYLSFPNARRGMLRFKRDIADFPPYHLNRISDSGMRKIAERCGYRVADCTIQPRDITWTYATSLAVNHLLDKPALRDRLAASHWLNLAVKGVTAVLLQPIILWRLVRYRDDLGFTVLYKLQSQT